MAFVSSEIRSGEAVGEMQPDRVPGGRHGGARGPRKGVMGPDLSWEDIGFLGKAMAVAPKQWKSAATPIREEYSLGPRGPWILGLIASGEVVIPSDLTKIFQCGRSLVTAELNRLSEAGLINSRKSDEDGRQVELSLTPMGIASAERVGASLVKMVRERLVGYSREDILFCARLLRDFGYAGNEPG